MKENERKTMKQNDKDFIELWESRRHPKFRYIITQGLVFWALPVFIVVVLMGFLFGTTDITILATTLPIRLTIWAIAGLLFGWLMWNLNEKKYQKLKDNDFSDNSSNEQ